MPLSETSGSDPRYFDVAICTLTAFLVPISMQEQRCHVVVYALFLLGGILGVGLSTSPLDNQMQETLLGLGFLLSSSFLLVLFDGIPSLSSSSLERHWQVWALYYVPLYCLYLPFFGGVRPVTIPISFLCGILIGAFRLHYRCQKFPITTITSILAGLLFGFGVRYLLRVWGFANTVLCDVITALSVILDFLVGSFRYQFTQMHEKNRNEEETNNDTNCNSNNDMNEECDQDGGTSTEDQEQKTGSFLRQKINFSRFRSKTPRGKLYSMANWLLWLVLCIGSLFLTAINIGACSQLRSMDHYFPIAEEAIYKHMNEGPVCAMDDVSQRENATIQTFDSPEAAHADNYSIVHCGACGSCSNWENLEVEYVTRNYLANAARKCATKSFSGGFEAVNECMEEPPISFTGTCAQCWSRDVMCTKKHCTFIFLQTVLINKLTNYSVGENINTAASCEEAFCEMENSPGSGEMGFVECSGATRRRMNISSTIPRPIEQQCTVVDLDWDEIFQGESGGADHNLCSILLSLMCMVWILAFG